MIFFRPVIGPCWLSENLIQYFRKFISVWKTRLETYDCVHDGDDVQVQKRYRLGLYEYDLGSHGRDHVLDFHAHDDLHVRDDLDLHVLFFNCDIYW